MNAEPENLSPDAEQVPPADSGAPVLVTDLASRVLGVKEGELFLYSNKRGDLTDRKDFGLGLYYKDTRFLSHLSMTISGREPVLLSSSSERASRCGCSTSLSVIARSTRAS